MDFGFSLPTRGPLAEPGAIAVLVARAEALGFDCLAVSDHIVIPRSAERVYPYATDGRLVSPVNWLEQLTLLTWVAAQTSTARLLTSVTVVPHRNPVHLAKILATVDLLSGGRVTLGCGTGWQREEFEALGAEPFDERGRVTDEYIRVFRELWTAPEPAFSGDYVDFKDIYFEPKPVQAGGVPVWIGGESGPALRRAATLGDGWYPGGANWRFALGSAALYAARAKELEALAEAADRDPAGIDRAFLVTWQEGGGPYDLDDGGRFLCTGSGCQIAEDVMALAELGVRHMVFNLLEPTLEQSLERLERFAAEVVASVNR
jgi:probable F420-dependent oxidoreductase